jgi:hypothetical protein
MTAHGAGSNTHQLSQFVTIALAARGIWLVRARKILTQSKLIMLTKRLRYGTIINVTRNVLTEPTDARERSRLTCSCPG